ncbi:hypothetical protein CHINAEXTREME_05500 [Halobiforma lacisalsi AJ5]|uniref:SHOCT domain-containing protein n=1 Tax=Natronobacterium lacisalsi AJ5 TaxID=358396 RepID=M0LMS9_NATLA|nr:SHOCT domain-containing protein [Halobiforma lacisalsi]APW97259.1 hypothetical protein CHINAEXTREME_05500 [Halobiforma lacisalsi AJ5]EMA33769.1 hypothetical protein C445_08774 [Halobiforma lacisalsi AJ5]
MTDSNPLLRTIVVVLLAVLAIPLVMMLVAMPFAGAMHAGSGTGTGMWSGGMGTTGWLWMSAVPLLLLLLLGYGAIRLLGGDDGDAALEELRRAYARGDLTDEEYETRRQRLEAESNEP